MNAGQTLFAQLMDCVPWKTFGRIVARYEDDQAFQLGPVRVLTGRLVGKHAIHRNLLELAFDVLPRLLTRT